MRHIVKSYHLGGEEIKANDDINLDIDRGEFVSIVGKSGSGKSTLMNIIGALDVATSGDYFLSGEDVSHMSDDQLADIRNRMIGFVFQQYNLLPKLKVIENVELPLLYANVGVKERRERAFTALEKVGLKDKAYNMPNQLSGGQQQRVSIARALAANPSLILADEPTGALDSKSTDQLLEVFEKLNNAGQTIIMVTHSVKTAARAKRVLFIKDGVVFHELRKGNATTSEMFQKINDTLTLMQAGE